MEVFHCITICNACIGMHQYVAQSLFFYSIIVESQQRDLDAASKKG